jgi:putative protease
MAKAKAKKKTAAKPAAKKSKKVKEVKPVKAKAEVTEVKREVIGKVTHFFTEISVAVIELAKPLKIGDKISIEGETTNLKQTVDSMQIDRKPVKEAKKGDAIGMKVKDRVREHDMVYRA